MSAPENPDRNVIEALRRRLDRARDLLDVRHGRDVRTADRIDRLQLAIDALTGELHCPHCEARLTSGL